MASTPEALAHAQLEWDTPLYRMAVAQFDQAVPVAGSFVGKSDAFESMSVEVLVTSY